MLTCKDIKKVGHIKDDEINIYLIFAPGSAYIKKAILGIISVFIRQLRKIRAKIHAKFYQSPYGSKQIFDSHKGKKRLTLPYRQHDTSKRNKSHNKLTMGLTKQQKICPLRKNILDLQTLYTSRSTPPRSPDDTTTPGTYPARIPRSHHAEILSAHRHSLVACRVWYIIRACTCPGHAQAGDRDVRNKQCRNRPRS